MYKLMDAFDDKVGAQGAAQDLKPYMPIIVRILQGLWYIGQGYWWLYTSAYALWEKYAPKLLIQCSFGLCLAFFGGGYGISIAAYEAFHAAGYTKFWYSVLRVVDTARDVHKALELDDYKDDDWDGIADVDQLEPKELIRRKITVGMIAVKEPAETQAAGAYLWAAYLSMLATLKFRFARVTAYAVAIAQALQFFLVKTMGPFLYRQLPRGTRQWCAQAGAPPHPRRAIMRPLPPPRPAQGSPSSSTPSRTLSPS